MSDTELIIVKPDLMGAAAPKTDIYLNTELVQTQSEIIDYNKTTNISLLTVFDNERQKSTTFRPINTISYIYDNNIRGFCPPNNKWFNYNNNLFYTNPEASLNTNVWTGLPSYQEFEFIRTDVTNPQLNFTSFGGFTTKSATSYNWNIKISYPFENITGVTMSYDFGGGRVIQWVNSNGLPFIISQGTDNGLPIIQFVCPVPHNVKVGEYVELSSGFTYNSINTFQVSSLGNNTYDSEKYIFNMENVGFTGSTFNSARMGTFKRIINIFNSGETKSKYYIRNHKLLTSTSDMMLTKNGFEKNSFADRSVYQLSALTPNGVAKVVKFQSSNTYNVTFERDIDINGLLDNNGKPITQLFLTFQWCGYFGWHDRLRRGWGFNMQTGSTNNWFDTNNNGSQESVTQLNYTRQSGGTFNFIINKPKEINETFYGDYCEYNDIEQTEYVISNYMHKMSYNQTLFTTDTTSNQKNPQGYYYQVHHPIIIKVFSDYVESASGLNPTELPNYAFYSHNQNLWLWRDIYTYGFFNELGEGVNYPFLNDAHYPFTNVIFKLYNQGSSFNILDYYQITIEPIEDPCE